jgi:hypothetical protein
VIVATRLPRDIRQLDGEGIRVVLHAGRFSVTAPPVTTATC